MRSHERFYVREFGTVLLDPPRDLHGTPHLCSRPEAYLPQSTKSIFRRPAKQTLMIALDTQMAARARYHFPEHVLILLQAEISIRSEPCMFMTLSAWSIRF